MTGHFFSGVGNAYLLNRRLRGSKSLKRHYREVKSLFLPGIEIHSINKLAS
jgi:hypothetical protein